MLKYKELKNEKLTKKITYILLILVLNISLISTNAAPAAGSTTSSTPATTSTTGSTSTSSGASGSTSSSSGASGSSTPAATTSTTAVPSAASCNLQLATIDKLVEKIGEKNVEKNKEIYNCLATTTQNKTLLIANSNAQTIKDLNSDPRIKLFKESYNKIKHCFFPIEIPQEEAKVSEARKITYGSTEFDLITFKVIDASGNNNCKLDTDHESCIATLESQKISNPIETKNKIANDLYGCYGNEPTPRNLLESTQDLRNINSFQVFDEEKGLIANQAQKANLKNLSENTGGPVIGFINMIIEYLVGIVFVLCMGSLIYGGYNYIFAGFDSDMQEKGKNAIKYAGIGFFLIMMSYTIVILVQSIF